MKYRIIEHVDCVGDSVFYGQYQRKTWYGKIVWEYVLSEALDHEGTLFVKLRFNSVEEARIYLKKHLTKLAKIETVVEEGEL